MHNETGFARKYETATFEVKIKHFPLLSYYYLFFMIIFWKFPNKNFVVSQLLVVHSANSKLQIILNTQ